MFLSDDDDDLMVGNLSGDFVTIAEMRFIDEKIKQGVELHRSIDRYTDTHSVVNQSIARLSGVHGKYAAVIVDILYDHLLCRHWSRYTEESLDDFKTRNYAILDTRLAHLPKRLKKRMPEMIARDFIEGYRSLDGMRVVMRYMDKRTSFPSDFVGSVDYFEANISDFDTDFNAFFPDLMTHVNKVVDAYANG